MDVPEDNVPPLDGVPTEPPVKKSPRRAAITLLICLAVCSGLLTIVVVWAQQAQEDARFAHCQSNLKMLALGLQNFDAQDGGLPPAYLCDEKGTPIHSWQALLVPLIGYYHWRGAYILEEPWDGPTNRECQRWPLRSFQCPSVGNRSQSSINTESRLTIDYVAVAGPDTMWPGRDRVRLPSKGDGNQDTILLIEMPDSDYRCLDPRCPTVEEFIEKIRSPTGKGIRCIHPKGLAYVTVCGEVRWFPPDTDPQTIRHLFKRDPKCKVVPAKEKVRTVEHWEDEDKGR
jgi:hypothetical protein